MGVQRATAAFCHGLSGLDTTSVMPRLDAPKGLVVSATGDALTCRSLGVEIAVSSLVAAVLGSRRLSATFAQRGGYRTSKAKAAAARINGAKGGRPPNRSGR
jgi:hypothetical protein